VESMSGTCFAVPDGRNVGGHEQVLEVPSGVAFMGAAARYARSQRTGLPALRQADLHRRRKHAVGWVLSTGDTTEGGNYAPGCVRQRITEASSLSPSPDRCRHSAPGSFLRRRDAQLPISSQRDGTSVRRIKAIIAS